MGNWVYILSALSTQPYTATPVIWGKWVYILCAIASIICALLLGRAYFNNRARILLWSTLCFLFLALNNILLFIDVIVFPGPDVDLRIPRGITYVIALVLLVFGLIWDAD